MLLLRIVRRCDGLLCLRRLACTLEEDLAGEVVDLVGGFELLRCVCRVGSGCMEFLVCGGEAVERLSMSVLVTGMGSVVVSDSLRCVCACYSPNRPILLVLGRG